MKNRQILSLALLICALLLSTVPASTMPSAAPAVSTLPLLAQIGGESSAVAYQGGYTYVGVGPRLVVVDALTNASQPTVAGQSPLLGGVVQGVAIRGNLAYVTLGEAGMQVVDLSNPASLTLRGSYNTSGWAAGIVVAGNSAYIADGPAGLVVLDVTNPDVVTSFYSYNTPGDAIDIDVAVDGADVYAYIADGGSGLQIVEVAPTPGFVGSYLPAGFGHYFEGVAVSEPYAYVTDGYSGLRVLDVTNRASPSEDGSEPTAGSAQRLVLNGDYAYVAAGDGGLSIIDVSDSTLPSEVGFYDTPGWSWDVAVNGDYAYLAVGPGGLRVINAGVPSNPAEVGTYIPPGFLEGVGVMADYAFTAEGEIGVSAVDLAVPTAPQKVGSFDTPGYAWGLQAAADHAWVADGDGGLRILDVTDPAAMDEAGFYLTSGPAEGVALYGDVAVVAMGSDGLSLVDATSLMAPTEVATYSTFGDALDVVVDAAGLAYVAEGFGGLEIVDVFDPARPDYVGLYDTSGYAEGVAAAGGYAYVADGDGGLLVLDATNPALPNPVGSVATDDYSMDVDTMGNYYAFLADGAAGVRVIDVTEPMTPTEIAAYDTAGFAADVVTMGGYVLVADSEGGLWIFQFGEADLSVSKTNGTDIVVPGTPVTYTVVVSNAGPYAVAGVTVSDTVPANLSDVTWRCDLTPGSNCPAGVNSGDVMTTVDLAVGGQVTFTITGTVPVTATGRLTNSVEVMAPPGVSVLNSENDSATDVDAIQATADLSIAKWHDLAAVTAGAELTYTVVVSNAGPSAVSDAVVYDAFPAELLDPSWTCEDSPGASCPASGVGSIDALVDLMPGSVVTFTASVTVDPAATGSLTNTAVVTAPDGLIDPDDANNSATVTDAIAAGADLSVSKDDGLTAVMPGQLLTYTVVVSNAGPSAVSDAAVSDVFPAELLDPSWTCEGSPGAGCPASGVGSIDALVDLMPGGIVTFTAGGTVDPAATGSLANTASVTPPAGVDDPDDANNSATDTDVITDTADLSVAKAASTDAITTGMRLTYTIHVTNDGPAAAAGVVLTDDLPAGADLAWASPGCVLQAGSLVCDLGSMNDGASLDVTVAVTPTAAGTLVNEVSLSAATLDPVPANNADSVSVDVELAPVRYFYYLPIMFRISPAAQ